MEAVMGTAPPLASCRKHGKAGNEIEGVVEEGNARARYEVLELGRAGALVWSVAEGRDTPRTSSGGFGWVEPFRSSQHTLDPTALLRRIEKRMRARLAASQAA